MLLTGHGLPFTVHRLPFTVHCLPLFESLGFWILLDIWILSFACPAIAARRGGLAKAEALLNHPYKTKLLP